MPSLSNVEVITLRGSGRGEAALPLFNGTSAIPANSRKAGKRLVGIWNGGGLEVYVEAEHGYFYYDSTLSGPFSTYERLAGIYSNQLIWSDQVMFEGPSAYCSIATS